jgi:hypothetical protein
MSGNVRENYLVDYQFEFEVDDERLVTGTFSLNFPDKDVIPYNFSGYFSGGCYLGKFAQMKLVLTDEYGQLRENNIIAQPAKVLYKDKERMTLNQLFHGLANKEKDFEVVNKHFDANNVSRQKIRRMDNYEPAKLTH